MKILAINIFGVDHGSTFRLRDLRKMLISSGHQVMYVESNYSANYSDEEAHCIGIKQGSGLTGFIPATIRRVWLSLVKDYDLLLMQKFTPLTVPCILAAKLRGRGVMVDWDDLSSALQRQKARRLLVSLFERSPFVRLADLVTAHNRYLMELAAKRGAREVAFIPQVIDTELFNPHNHDGDSIKAKMGFGDRHLLLFLANFVQGGVRDLDVILAGVKAAAERNPAIHLLVAGGGPLLEEYEKLAQNMGLRNVTFTGLIPREEVPSYLAAADTCLIFMRDDEGNRMRMSLKTLEYLSMRKRVVGHLVGETRDALGRFCHLCDESTDALAEAIISSADLPADMGGREYVCKNHGLSAMEEALRLIMNGDWRK